MWVTNQSDTWQNLTRAKSRVTSAEASAIGISLCQEHSASRTPKSRNAILRSYHSRWLRMNLNRRSYPCSEFRGSGFGIAKNFEHQTSRNRDMRFPDKAYSLWATQESVEDRCKEKIGGRESEYRSSRGRMHIIFENPKIPTSGMVAVT